MRFFFGVLFFIGVLGCGMFNAAWGAETTLPAQANGQGNTPAADAVEVPGAAIGTSLNARGDETYEENQWLEDFQVHFFVSLPFTALYSYLAVTTLDGLVQGKYPAAFREADMWVVTGLALGSSLAVALGSYNRVPDQSVPRLAENEPPDFSGREKPLVKMALFQVEY